MILKKSKKNLKIKSKTKSKKNLKTKSKKNLRGGALTFGELTFGQKQKQPLRTRYAGISKKIEATHAARKQSVQPFQPTKPLDFYKASEVVKTPYSPKINYSKI